ncbi:two-component regulator propeller domain-containing protein [Parapedobacter pyrenivorans]|uniref:two-component regulator propeller domain-containing protein n=1 Tax=Parapedobacter pyrenivorans TaxID=1305674 RepID=UPI003341C5EA
MIVMLIHVSSAQERLYNFEWFTEEGLVPGNAIRRIVTDSEGFVWLATNKGLYLFDLVNSKNFTHDHLNPKSISSNNLSGVYQDAAGGMWITSYTGGLSYYDKSLSNPQAFTNYTSYWDGRDTVSIRMLNDVVSDADGNIWFGGQDTDVLKMDASTKQISRVAMVADSLGPLSIYDLFRGSDGKIWVGTRHHGIFCVDPTTGTIKAYNLKPDAKPWVEENGCGSFAERDGILWFSYYDYNLCSLNLNSGELKTNLLGIGPNERVYDNAIHAVAIRGNTVLAGHQSKGIYCYDRTTGTRSLLDWKTLTPEDPTSDIIATINVDAGGMVWIGTRNKGLIRYSDYQNRFSTFYPLTLSQPIEQLAMINGGRWWYRTASHIHLYDKREKKPVKTYDLNGLWVSNFTEIAGQIYLSTYDKGVWVHDGSTRPYPLPIQGDTYGFRQADCGNIVPDTIGGVPHLWIAAWNSGLYKYNCANQTLTLTNAGNGLPDNKLICMAKDMNGDVWVGTDGFGLLRISDKESVAMDRFRTEMPDAIPSNTVRAIVPSTDGSVWVVTEYLGVSNVRKSGSSFVFQNIPNTNPTPWQNPQVALEDALGNLWISMEDGLIVFDKRSKKFKQLQSGQGVVPPSYIDMQTFAAASDSTILMATNRGFVMGHANDVVVKRALPTAVINSFFVHDHDFSHLLRSGPIELNHEQNFFTFTLSAPGAVDPHEMQFAFMLEGVDKDWRLAKADFSVAYTDISRGDYRFLVRTGDDMGNWSEHASEVPIRINGPYWQTPWFYGVFVILLFLIAYGVFRYRLNQSKKLNAMQSAFNEDLKRQLALKTAEVTAQVERIESERKEKLESDYRKRLSESELKAIRAQMNPHFMFNVLNSIESYILEKDAKAASRLVQKFAKLNRLVLENSAYSYVSVAREWEALNLYVELEALRFNNEFDYDFSVAGNMDMKNLFIPPMLVQPLIENAIHHGIRQHVGQRGRIQVAAQQNGDCICFTVVDNGAGLEKSRSKPSHPYKKTSMGLATIEERLKLINRNAGCTTGRLELTSLKVDGLSGTKAVLCIPLVLTPFSILD